MDDKYKRICVRLQNLPFHIHLRFKKQTAVIDKTCIPRELDSGDWNLDCMQECRVENDPYASCVAAPPHSAHLNLFDAACEKKKTADNVVYVGKHWMMLKTSRLLQSCSVIHFSHRLSLTLAIATVMSSIPVTIRCWTRPVQAHMHLKTVPKARVDRSDDLPPVI
jgi:hypothetical protein